MPARDPTTATSALSEEHSENIRCFLVADCSAIVSILCTKTLSLLNIFAKRSPQCWPAIRRSDLRENPSETSATARASIKCAYGQSSGQRALAVITNSLHARSYAVRSSQIGYHSGVRGNRSDASFCAMCVDAANRPAAAASAGSHCPSSSRTNSSSESRR